ncbi:MAG: MaoC family dehydratase [Parvularculaceae bacterium]
MRIVAPADVKSLVGEEVGVSEWVLIDQDLITRFADVTDDRQFIHVNPEAAKAPPFGGTVAHGFLTLSMLSKLAVGSVIVLDGIKMAVNYGFDKVRFLAPVRSGRRIRGRFTLMKADERVPGQWRFTYAVRVEVEDEERPALLAEWITAQMV